MVDTKHPVPVVVDTSRRRYTQLRPVPITAVTLADQFWAPRRHINHATTLPSQFQHLEESHRLDNFRRVSGKVDRPFEGPIFNDTDVYKWLEAAAWTLASENDPELERMVDLAITEVADAQQPDGYLHSYFWGDKAHERWSNLRDLHEMYNAGHLIQAAVAHYRELSTMDGHAVRAVYYTTGATDLYAESGEQAMRDALERLWHNMVTRRMYVSGGIGARREGEAFGKDFELPNERAYTETCAAIGSVMWNWRMLAIDGEARFADLMEQSLYNGVLPGLSLNGQEYFYQNPLEDDGTHRRQPWFGCACCPPNVARLLASLPGYFYSVSDAGVWTHLYAEGQAKVELSGGNVVRLQQRTRYPWDGEVTLEVNGEGEFSLFLRIPAWCEDGAALEIDGQPFGGPLKPGTYAEIRRAWRPGDTVHLTLPMPVRRIACHPYVTENRGRVAIMRGPLLYCVEEADNPGFDLRDVVLPAHATFTPEFRANLLGGVTILRGTAEARKLP